MENKKIGEFSVGDKIEGFFLVKQADCKTTNSNNKKYFDFTLADKTGEINAKLWECEDISEDFFKANSIIKIRGTILNWQNSLQLKIERIRNAEANDNIIIEDYVPTSPVKSEDMLLKILSTVDSMKNKDLQNILYAILEDKEDKLMHYPAAKKNHHSIRGGLLYHTTTMLDAGKKLCEVYDFLNKDLLYAGIILHDIAKIEEMDASELGIVNDYTIEGQLLGHITMGVKLLEVYGNKVNANKEIVMLLQHMVLSHHYEPEFGSPLKPMFPEAEMLHFLDILDARMFDMKKAIGETKKGEFSDRIWSLDNRKVYKMETEW